MFDALDASFLELKVRRDPNCPVCSYLTAEADERAMADSAV